MAMICFSANSIEEDVAAASEAWVPAEADPGAMGVPESVVHSLERRENERQMPTSCRKKRRCRCVVCNNRKLRRC